MARTRVAVAPMKAAQISKPAVGQVLIEVLACGVCPTNNLL
jgi:D-arabinose 1-dehydrogenase-like Zn-dependent alcohol dehydrogenase